MNRHTLFSSGGLIAAVLTTSCCALPFLLFSIGVGGAWIGKLRVLEPYSNYFMVTAVCFVALGFYAGHKRKRKLACDENGYCSTTSADRVRAAMLWMSLVLIITAALWPNIVQLFFGSST
jgi:mercuric ion transport protein